MVGYVWSLMTAGDKTMRHWYQTIRYDTDLCTAERPQSRQPVDGPDAPIHPHTMDNLRAAIAEGLRGAVAVVAATL